MRPFLRPPVCRARSGPSCVPALVKALGAAIFLLAGGAGAQTGPPASGFETIVVQPPPGIDPDRFGTAVVDALPHEMKDPATNFMRDPVNRPDAPYRLVMVFHGSTEPPRRNLCIEEEAAAQTVPQPPAPQTTTGVPTSVTAAFCHGSRSLSEAQTRITGGVDPAEASFRFLVSDVAKQLFPLGFATLPSRGTGSGATLPPS
jgi:hypothetical protein